MHRVVALLGLLLALSAAIPVAAEEPPAGGVRVLHVTVDSLHPDEIGPQTPTLQALAAQGVVYAEARAVMASETLPNHVALGTGTYPGRNGIPGNEGRATVGDTEAADPDLGDPDLLEVASFVEAVERACPDLRTVTVFSKAYVHRVFLGDPVDARYPQELFNIPESDHAPDASTVGFILQELQANRFDYLFANLGDVDRAGHVDATGFTGFAAFRQVVRGQTDSLLGLLVEELKRQGLWEDLVLVISSDHSMDFSNTLDPTAYVDLGGALASDPRTAGRFFVSENGGAGLVYLLDPTAGDAPAVLAAAREVLVGLTGVDEALYRRPNPLDPGHDLDSVHPDWHLSGSERAGELFLTVQPGHKFSTPLIPSGPTRPSNPVPGNHGHAITRHAVAIVTGGWDGIAGPTVVAASDPDAVDRVHYDDTAALPEQAEQVDFAPTFGWLLGVPDPGMTDGSPQWQGRVLREAFSRQPQPRCVRTLPDPTVPPTVASTGPAAPDPAAPAPATPALPSTGGGGLAAGGGLLAVGALVAGRRSATAAR